MNHAIRIYLFIEGKRFCLLVRIKVAQCLHHERGGMLHTHLEREAILSKIHGFYSLRPTEDMTETNASLNDLIAQRDALTEKIAELKKGRSEAIKKIIAVMGRFAISVDEIQLALPSAAPSNAFDTAPAKAPYTGKKRGRKPKGTSGQTPPSGGSDMGHGAAGAVGGGNPPESDLLQNAEAGAQTSSGAPADSASSSNAANADGGAPREDAAGDAPTAKGSQEPMAGDSDHSLEQRSRQTSDDEANPIPSAAPSAD